MALLQGRARHSITRSRHLRRSNYAHLPLEVTGVPQQLQETITAQQEYTSALKAAASAKITLLQPNNAPIVSGDQHYAHLLQELQEEHPEDASKRSAPAGSADIAPSKKQKHTQQKPRASKKENTDYASWHPVDGTLAAGDQVIIMKKAWPRSTTCDVEGLGWKARVKKVTKSTAIVALQTGTPSGRKYADIRIAKTPLLLQAKGALRGGRNPSPATADTYTPPAAGPLNRNGYPQLVPSDKCALCKRPLEPLAAESRNWRGRGPPTRIATPERLQCERCAAVRYCSAWCAHIHYWACHRHIWPIPDFSTEYKAEYIIRNGRTVLAFPVRCVDAQLLDNGTYHTTERLQARAHMWASVAHKGTRLQPLACMWCTSTVTPQTAGLRHDVWFVGLITRVRAAPRAQWPNEPKWTPPLLIYESP